jgi:hypothetical protein
MRSALNSRDSTSKTKIKTATEAKTLERWLVRYDSVKPSCLGVLLEEMNVSVCFIILHSLFFFFSLFFVLSSLQSFNSWTSSLPLFPSACCLPSTIPQVEHQITHEANITVLNINGSA